MIPIFITSKVPGTWPNEQIEWTAVCRTKPAFITIGHDNLRPTSRWTWVDRKRKFSVTVYSQGRVGLHTTEVTWYETLAKARAGAIRKATDWHDFFHSKKERAS